MATTKIGPDGGKATRGARVLTRTKTVAGTTVEETLRKVEHELREPGQAAGGCQSRGAEERIVAGRQDTVEDSRPVDSARQERRSEAETELQDQAWHEAALAELDQPAVAGEDTEPVRDDQRLIPRQHQAVGLLVRGMTVTDVARELGVHRSTIHRWLDDPDFRLKLEARREELLTSMLDQQLLASRMATTKLIELLESEDERVALRTAIILYSGGQRIYYFADLKKRIELLENNMQIYYGGKV
jgi:transposase-like protein